MKIDFFNTMSKQSNLYIYYYAIAIIAIYGMMRLVAANIAIYIYVSIAKINQLFCDNSNNNN